MDSKELLRKLMHAWKMVGWIRRSYAYSGSMEDHYLELWYKYQDLFNKSFKSDSYHNGETCGYW